jgi:hypothetical protein
MTIQERKFDSAGFGGGRWFARVRPLAEGEPIPINAVAVPDETPAYDWKPEGSGE